MTEELPTAESELRIAVTAARTLLAYAVQSRVPMQGAIDLKSLTKAIESADASLKTSGPLDDAVRAEFWIQYDKLAALMTPVTAQSILATREVSQAGWLTSWSWPAPWLALVGVALFAVAAYLQGYWATGTDLLVQVEKLEAPRKAALDALIQPRMDVASAEQKAKQARTRLTELQAAITIVPPAADAAASAAPAKSRSAPRGVAPVAAPNPSNADSKAKTEPAEALETYRIEAPNVRAEIKAHELAKIDAESRFGAASAVLSGHTQVARSSALALHDWCRWLCDRGWIKKEEADRASVVAELESLRAAREQDRRHARVLRGSRQCVANGASLITPPDSVECTLDAQDKSLGTPIANLESKLRELDDAQIRSITQHARSVVERLGGYIIPMLMGTLGALVFLLRSIVNAIGNTTYLGTSFAFAVIHISLGSAAGLLGRLLIPASGGTALAGLSPFALAFSFGYGVQLLFTFLDKLIGTFTVATPPPIRPAPAAPPSPS